MRTEKGFTIDTFDKGQPLDTFEYDKDGKAIAGIQGIDMLENNYVKYFMEYYIC